MKCPLSLFLEHQCTTTISDLLQFNLKFRYDFLQNMDYDWVVQHPLSMEMIELLTKYSLDVANPQQHNTNYIIPVRSGASSPIAAIFYTKEVESGDNRVYADKQYNDIWCGLQQAGFSTRLINSRKWRWEELTDDLGALLDGHKHVCSLFLLCGMTHGSEGYLYDSYMNPKSINDIQKLVNDRLNRECPKVGFTKVLMKNY